MQISERGRARRVRGAVAAVAVLVVGALLGWAATAVFAPPRDVIDASAFTMVELAEGEVGSSITLNTVATWPQVPAGTNQAAGTVTAVRVGAGDEVDVGSVLYEVNLRPVLVARGEVPAFRDLGTGAEGDDVRQLQQLLTGLGYYGGAQDGGFGARTERAVRAWQDDLGIPVDGVVRAGDLVFVPELPGRVALDGEIVVRGATLAGGEQVVSALAPQPTFTVPATAQQAAMMPVGTVVELTVEGEVWPAAVGGRIPSPDSTDQVEVQLQGADGGPVCTDSCSRIPVEGESLLTSRIVTQPTVTGVVAPSAALTTDPDGTVSVIDEAGAAHPVSVVASANGMSVVEGVDAGLRVRTPATDATPT